VNTQRAAEIQVLLEGVRLPASRKMLIEYAAREDAAAVAELRALPDGEYRRLDDVASALLGESATRRVEPRLPQPESGAPPGGPAYTGSGSADMDTGFVRDDAPPANPPAKAIDKQSKTQKRQQARQSS
jgi:Protein of unknown function (DUF2795)